MIAVLQIGGVAILVLASLQALSALISQVHRSYRTRQMEALKLERFKAETSLLLKKAGTDLQRNADTWSGKRKFRISERQAENKSGSICSFFLTPHDGGTLPAFKPGQFLTFELRIPSQTAPVVRCYSLSDSPDQTDRYRVTIKHLKGSAENGVPDGVSSSFFHEMLQVGDVVDVLAPNGQFVLDTASDRPIVLIAGGVGLTPLLSMLKWLDKADTHREVHFIYCARDGAEIACATEIEEIIARHANFHWVRLFSSPTDGCREGRDFDCEGTLSIEQLRQLTGPLNHQYYVCGPPPMMDKIVHQLQEAGVPSADIHFEAFGPATVRSIGKTDHPGVGSVEGTSVRFSRTGKSAEWTESDGSLLDFAEAAGISVVCGCRAGNCGTCATALKEGDVSYLTPPASKPAAGTVLLCIARPNGEVELDI